MPAPLLALVGMIGAAPPPANGDSLVKVRLATESRTLTPGRPADIGVVLNMAPGWHTYWDGVNDSGGPIRLTLDLPNGWTAGEPLWPAPVRHLAPGDVLDHVYEGEVMVIVPVFPPAGPPGTHPLAVDAAWLVCSDVCLPGKGRASLDVRTAAGAAPNSDDAPRFTAARARLPRAIDPEHPEAVVRWETAGASLIAEGAGGLEFYPRIGCSPLTNAARDGAGAGPELRIELAGGPGGEPRRLFGVLMVTGRPEKGAAYYHVDSREGPTR